MPTYTVFGVDGDTYAGGVTTAVELDATTEVGATAEIFVDPGTPTLVQVPAGITVTYTSAHVLNGQVVWSPDLVSPGFAEVTFEVYDSAMSVLQSDVEFNAYPDFAGVTGLGPVAVPFGGGFVGLIFHNASAQTLTQLGVGEPLYGGTRLSFDWSLTANWNVGGVGSSWS